MGLNNVLGTALAGMRVNQSALDNAARNIANADTPGYTAKRHNQEAIVAGSNTSVGDLPSSRELDPILQRQLRVERANGSAANELARYHERIDALFGQPGGENALDTRFNAMAEAFQALTASPESFTARADAVDEAMAFTQHLNAMSRAIQELRLDTEREIGAGVDQVNGALERLHFADTQIATGAAQGNPDLLDERDRALDELSGLMDIRVNERGDGSVSVFTRSGVLLYDRAPASLSFDERSAMAPEALYSEDPQTRGVGTITVESPTGSSVDLLRNDAVRSGKLAGLVEMRDDVLVEAQNQLDELASRMAVAMSSKPVAGEAIAGGQSIDTDAMAPWDSLSVTFRQGGQERSLNVVRVEDGQSLDDTYSADPNDRVIAVSFEDGDDLAQAVQDALDTMGAGLSVAANGGSLEITRAGGDLVSLSGSVVETGLAGGSAAVPLFVDGGDVPVAFRDSIEAGVPQSRGFAGRITVNPDIVRDNAGLVEYSGDAPAADPARPEAILDRLTGERAHFSHQTGIGSETSPFRGSLADFAQTVTAHRGRESAQAQRAKEGQDIVVNSLEQRHFGVSGVNLDEEMGQLLQLQNAYAANARVMSTVQEMMDVLLRM